MNTLDIITFMTIVETRSLSKAAAELFISQSTVSHRLKSLEENIGFSLVVRRKGYKSIELTRKGEEFVNIAERYLSINRDIEQLNNSVLKKKLHVGCVETLNSVVFQHLYKNICMIDPNLSLDVSSHWSYIIYNLINSHELDIGFVLRQIQTRNVISKPLFRERMVMIYNINFTRYPHELHPTDLDITKEVYLNWSPNYQRWHEYWYSFTCDYKIKVDSSSLILQFILTTDSWSIVPISLAKAFEKLYPIGITELSEKPPDRICYIIKHKYPSSGTHEVITEFEKHLNTFLESESFISLT